LGWGVNYHGTVVTSRSPWGVHTGERKIHWVPW